MADSHRVRRHNAFRKYHILLLIRLFQHPLFLYLKPDPVKITCP